MGSKRARLGVWVLVALWLLACGSPPEQDFYEPPSKSGGGGSGPTSTALTLTVTTSSSSTNATSTGGSSTSSSTAGSTNGSSTSGGGTGGAEQTEATSSSTSAGTMSCDELPTWDGGNPEFTLGEGDEMQHNGRRYRANEAITFPNPECAPDQPVDWCAGWFEDLGPC